MTLARTASVECRDKSQKMGEGGGLRNEWELEEKSRGENLSYEVGESQRVSGTGRAILR